MEVVKLLFMAGGIVSAITVFFFTWIIQMMRTQNKSVMKQMSATVGIKVHLEKHEIKIEYLENNMRGINKKIEEILTDMSDLKIMVRENNILMQSFKDSQNKIETMITKLSRK